MSTSSDLGPEWYYWILFLFGSKDIVSCTERLTQSSIVSRKPGTTVYHFGCLMPSPVWGSKSGVAKREQTGKVIIQHFLKWNKPELDCFHTSHNKFHYNSTLKDLLSIHNINLSIHKPMYIWIYRSRVTRKPWIDANNKCRSYLSNTCFTGWFQQIMPLKTVFFFNQCTTKLSLLHTKSH